MVKQVPNDNLLKLLSLNLQTIAELACSQAHLWHKILQLQAFTWCPNKRTQLLLASALNIPSPPFRFWHQCEIVHSWLPMWCATNNPGESPLAVDFPDHNTLH